MIISHKNSLPGYLGDWRTKMDFKARVERKPSSGLRVPQPLQSLMRHELNLCIMIELFDESLTRFEKSLNGKKADCDYGAYPEALCFLDSIYLFSRILWDSIAGIIGYIYNERNKGHELSERFNKILTKARNEELLDNLNTTILRCEPWFSQLRDRRDDIVHRYETNFIGTGKNSEGDRTATQFSPKKKTQEIEDLRSYIGMVMAGYQRFIDGLLDYWDEMFISWYNFSVFRHSTILMGRTANILWWAYQYGGYRNDNMVVSES